jgi:predicted chitinase
MSKRLIISEEEKKDIKKLYSINEGFIDDAIDLLKKSDVGQAVKSFVNDIFGTTDVNQIVTKVKDKVEDLTSDEEDEMEKQLADAKLKDLTYGNEDKYSGDLVHTFSGQEARNIDLLVDAMNDFGITDPMTQIGILSVIGKETNYIPKSETTYSNTSPHRIRKLFRDRVSHLSDDEINKLKKDDEKFYNLIYAKTVGNDKNGTNDGDGYKYRGRGFNQLTGIGNYRKYGGLIGKDLVSNPDEANNPRTAANIAIMFFTKGKKTGFPEFKTKKDAADYFAKINAGKNPDKENDPKKENDTQSVFSPDAVKYSEKFDIK